MTIALRGKTAPSSVSVYHELDYNVEAGQPARKTGGFVFGPMPAGFVLTAAETARLVAYLTDQPVPPWSSED